MFSSRTDQILKFIVQRYIAGAAPVSSQCVTDECGLGVSPATIRNEMAYLESEGYISRPHHSAGSVPSDKGYRYYVDSLHKVNLPLPEQRMIGHLFHQIEKSLEDGLGLAVTVMAKMTQNIAIITMPKSADSRFKQLELIALQDSLVLLIIILHGIKIRQQIITFDTVLSQPTLTIMANKLSTTYSDLDRSQIQAKDIELSPAEQQLTDYLVKIMGGEDEQEYEQPYLEGWHFMLNQPEFAQTKETLALMELVDERSLLKAIVPPQLSSRDVQVVIGNENKVESIRNCSVVIRRYGLPEEATGTISVLGPTRMPYLRAISGIEYLSSVLSSMVAELYGKKNLGETNQRETNY